MITKEENGVKVLDLEAYIETYAQVKISKDLILKVGKMNTEEFIEFEAENQKILENKDGKKDLSEEAHKIHNQLMVILRRHNPELTIEKLKELPPAALSKLYQFVVRESAGLGEGLGEAQKEAVGQDISV